MEVDSIPQDVKQNVDAGINHQLQKMSLSDPPQEQNKKDSDGEYGINQLQKMSLSDPPQEQNKKDIDGEDGNYQFRKSSPAWWHADDYFERLSPEELMAEVRPHQQWVQSHTCTSCGVIDYYCMCRQWAILENMELPLSLDEPMYGSSTSYVPAEMRF